MKSATNHPSLACRAARAATITGGQQLAAPDDETLARWAFAVENPPGKPEIAGSQDALGIVLPGLSRLHYSGEYWPARIERCRDDALLSWLESKLYLRWLGPRPNDYGVLQNAAISTIHAADLARAAADCWQAILARDTTALGPAVTASLAAQASMFPSMINDAVRHAIGALPKHCLGYKLAGAGGGGYLVAVADEAPAGFEPVRIRRTS